MNFKNIQISQTYLPKHPVRRWDGNLYHKSMICEVVDIDRNKQTITIKFINLPHLQKELTFKEFRNLFNLEK